jgi:hypothetical protein
VHFALVILEMQVLQSFCPGWLWTVILPISASQVAKIVGVSHKRISQTCGLEFCAGPDLVALLLHLPFKAYPMVAFS